MDSTRRLRIRSVALPAVIALPVGTYGCTPGVGHGEQMDGR